jgi:hypothetical protein
MKSNLMRREEKRNKMAAVRINTMGGQKEIGQESRPAFRRTNNALNFASAATRNAGSMQS